MISLPHLMFMRTIAHRSFLILLTAWLLVGNVGVAWSQATCLFTGVQKLSWASEKPLNNSRKSEIKRSPCFHYKHFHLKNSSAFVSKKLSISLLLPIPRAFLLTGSKPSFVCKKSGDFSGLVIPESQAVRRAHLQVYLI
jgi:hypothetical protein